MTKDKGYRVRPKSRRDIEYIASLVRKYFCSETEPFFPIMDVLEKRIQELIPDFELHIEPDGSLEGKARALTFPNEHIIMVEESVYLGALAGCGMDRTTLAHELGHLFMHPAVSFAKQFESTSVKTYENSEWQSDVFGGELLAPIRLISRKTIFEVEEEFGVSFAAARAQLKALSKKCTEA